MSPNPMTDQTKLREAVARAIHSYEFYDAAVLKTEACEIADSILSLPELADALKQEEEASSIKLRDLIASKESIVCMMQHDISKYGELSCDYNQPLAQIEKDIAACRAAMSGGEKK